MATLTQDTNPTLALTQLLVSQQGVNQYITIPQLQTLITLNTPASGAVGPSGPTGVQGLSGPTGPSGVSGPSGPSGLTGACGPTGPSGLRGVSGPSGPSGPVGLPGLSGPTGVTGPSGASVGAYTATNIAGGATGSILIQTAACKTGFVGIGPTGYILQSNGTTAAWVSTSTLIPQGSGGATQVYINSIAGGDSNTYYPALVRGNGGNFAEYAPNSVSFSPTTGAFTAPNLVATNTVTSAGLQVSGGATIGGNLVVCGTITASQLNVLYTTITQTTVTSPDVFTIKNQTQSSTVTNGALVVAGGVGISRTVRIGGCLYVGGNIIGGNLSTTAVSANNLNGGYAGSIPYQSCIGVTTFLCIGNNGQALFAQCGVPVWKGLGGASVGTATNAVNIVGGTAGEIPYQISPGVTGFVSAGTIGQVLASRGTCAPAYIQSVSAVNGIGSTSTSTVQSLTVSSGGLGVQGCSYFDSNVAVGGLFTHGGIVPSKGINVDQIYTTSSQITLSKAWTNTGISGNLLANGTYIIQVQVSDQGQGGGEQNMFYSGVMSWYNGNGTEVSSSEIPLHRAGATSGAGNIFLQVQRVSSGAPQLQISGLTNDTGPSTYVFNIRRMI